ncbi:MAG TPA: DUF3108 domain-containing protein [Candidatus Omnitrophota bacterium]|nr:DUF3108 domain-containing protein [Candidatus Omnitrophota bacterium]HRZ14360.1 DUF3108 domain-containing protein [Candidatus Omnitrophota bacterium]
MLKSPASIWKFRFLSAMILVAGCASSSGVSTVAVENPAISGRHARNIVIEQPELRLPDRARLTYQIKWLGIPVGTLVNTIKGIRNFNGRQCYVLESTMRTNFFFSAIFKVDDHFVSYMDVEKKHTLRHEAAVIEGSYSRRAAIDFDQERHNAYFKNFLNNSRKDFKIAPDVQDVVTAYYYLMLLPVVKVGDKIEFNGVNNELNYKLTGVIHAKKFIKVPAFCGEHQRAFVVKINLIPSIKGRKIDEGKSDIYFSSAKERFPLFAVIKGPRFTEVTATLVKVE